MNEDEWSLFFASAVQFLNGCDFSVRTSTESTPAWLKRPKALLILHKNRFGALGIKIRVIQISPLLGIFVLGLRWSTATAMDGCIVCPPHCSGL